MTALLSVACTACLKDCWPFLLGTFVLGTWFGLLILALLVAGREDR